MKRSIRITTTAIIIFVLAVTVASSVFGYIAMTNQFDHILYYFDANSVLGKLYIILPIIGAAASLALVPLMRKKVSVTDAPSANVPVLFCSVLSGLLMIVSSYFTLIGFESMPAAATISNYFSYNGVQPLSKVSLFAAIFGIIGGIYLILFPFLGKKPFMSLASAAPMVWAALKLLEENFREGDPMNSPIRTVNLTMFAFILLFFAEEIRFYVGRQIPGTYYFVTLSAIAFTGNAVIPKLIIILTDNSSFDFSSITWWLGAALLLFFIARLSAIPSVLGEYIEPAEEPAEAKSEE